MGRSVEALVEAVRSRGGDVKIRELAATCGLGERQLHRVFVDAVGVSPKQFARIARFLHACSLIRGSSQALTDVAHQCGYYDQAHFIHEIQEMADESPSALRRRDQVSFL